MTRGRLVIFLAALALALLPGTALADSCARDGFQSLFDSQGYEFDTVASPWVGLHDGGSNGPDGLPPGPVATTNSWNNWGALFVGGDDLAHVYSVPAAESDACQVDLGGQQLVFPAEPIDGLEVQRKLFASASGLPGGRLLELVTNPGGEPAITSVQVGDDKNGMGQLGSGAKTAVWATSDGNIALGSGDLWAVTSDHAFGTSNSSPALAHVFDGAGGREQASSISLNGPYLMYRWTNVVIPPQATVAFLSYEVQQVVADRNAANEDAAATSAALAYEGLPLTQVYAGMSDAEVAAVRNWPHPAPVAVIIASGSSDGADTRLSSAGSVSTAAGVCQGASFAWDFGDGTTGSGRVVSHRFAAGERGVRLTVTNSCGESASATKTLSITHAPPAVTAAMVKTITRKRLLAGKLVLTLISSEDASSTIVGTVPKSVAKKARPPKISRKVISARLRLSAGRAGSVRLKPSRRATRGLRRLPRGSFRLTVSAAVRDAAGKVTTVRRAVRVR